MIQTTLGHATREEEQEEGEEEERDLAEEEGEEGEGCVKSRTLLLVERGARAFVRERLSKRRPIIPTKWTLTSRLRMRLSCRGQWYNWRVPIGEAEPGETEEGMGAIRGEEMGGGEKSQGVTPRGRKGEFRQRRKRRSLT